MIVSHLGLSVRLELCSQNDGKTVVVKVNGEDYPVAFDLHEDKLVLCVWPQANTDKPETFELTGYVHFPLERAVSKAQVQAIAGQKTKLVVELDEGEDRKLVVVDEDYPDYDEFHAFDGKVLAEVDAEGSVKVLADPRS